MVEEAICRGWIDSKIKRVDEQRYSIFLTPRKPGSNWTDNNKNTAQRMIAAGRMTNAGMLAFAAAK